MSDPAGVRLVRCPKCENLLPEIEGYSVYQCGGCGAVLRAKTKDFDMDSLPQKSDEERVQVVEKHLYSKLDNFILPEKKTNSGEGSDNDVRSNASSYKRDEKRDENLKAEKWVVDDDLVRKETLEWVGHAEMERKFRDLGPSNGTTIGAERSESFADWKSGVGGREGFLGTKKKDFQALRYSTSIYPEDGPSNYVLRPSCDYGERIHNRNGGGELSNVEYLEQDRAELLRKLNELKDQISWSCDINEKLKEKVPLDPKMARQGVTYMNKSSCASQYDESSPYIGRQEMGVHTYYNPSQMLGRASHQEPNLYFPGHYLHEKMDPYVQSYLKDMDPHHRHCTCVHCYNNHARVASSVPHTAFQNKMLPHEAYPMLHRYENQSSFGPLDYHCNAVNSHPLGSRNPQYHRRRPIDCNFDVDRYGSHRPPRVAIISGKRRCHPVAGGSPLVSCYNCFQLLELPKKLSLTKMNHAKVRCRACSSVILFEIVDKKLVPVGVDANITKNLGVKNADLGLRERNLHTQVRANQVNTNFSSVDDNNSGYDFPFLDGEDQGYGSNKSENMRGFLSASSCSSGHEVSLDGMHPEEEGPNSAEHEAKTVFSPPLAGSPLQEHFDSSCEYRFEKGNLSGCSDREKAELRKITLRQNSMKDASLATEMEVTFNEDINTGTSLESGDTGKDEDQMSGNKGAQSFFAGVIKKSFKDFSKSNITIEQTSASVMINGHPITDRLLKKAQKIAGQVHPGQYWYDYRAGFWGVMGGPCLGIIPPFIEEFNYPMLENCAGGNTGVLVNGRELHQKDLNLLVGRGLPSIGDRSYIIEISGRVLDEDTGVELASLGKLAPTVEKVKHGFGMKVPRIAA